MRDIEILCVDDGSTDGSVAIMKKLAEIDSRIRIYGQKNAGPGAARNLGLANASGKYLMFCDSDDTYNADMCETMHREITENEVDCVCCRSVVVNESNAERQKFVKLDYYNNRGLLGVYDTDDKKVIAMVNALLWNKIFKRDIVNRFGISFPTGKKSEDDAFFFQYYAVAERIMFIKDALYNYLQRDNSIMGDFYAKRDPDYIDAVYSAKFYYDFISRNKITDRQRSFLCLLRMLNSIQWYLANFCHDAAKREKCDSLLKEFFPAKYLDYVKEAFLYHRSFFGFLSVEIIRRFSLRDLSFKKSLIVKVGGKKLFSVSKKAILE